MAALACTSGLPSRASTASIGSVSRRARDSCARMRVIAWCSACCERAGGGPLSGTRSEAQGVGGRNALAAAYATAARTSWLHAASRSPNASTRRSCARSCRGRTRGLLRSGGGRSRICGSGGSSSARCEVTEPAGAAGRHDASGGSDARGPTPARPPGPPRATASWGRPAASSWPPSARCPPAAGPPRASRQRGLQAPWQQWCSGRPGRTCSSSSASRAAWLPQAALPRAGHEVCAQLPTSASTELLALPRIASAAAASHGLQREHAALHVLGSGHRQAQAALEGARPHARPERTADPVRQGQRAAVLRSAGQSGAAARAAVRCQACTHPCCSS